MNIRSFGSSPAHARSQRGAVLFVALIFLVLMTLIAVVASNTSILQERMTGGMRNVQMAQMGADSGVRGMEVQIWTAPVRGVNLTCDEGGGPSTDFKCYSRVVASAASDTLVLDDVVRKFRSEKGKIASDGGSNSTIDYSATTIPESARLASRPRVMVELMGRVSGAEDTESPHAGLKPVAAGPGGGVQEFLAYRITSRSTGGNDSAVRLAESVFLAQIQPIATP
ncbi:type IV pilus assembly protein PilX [Tahibacter aquaticus]|uniref:Type IV pilus assembly protein PilX n=1 Tax=Tahibacter aquaticus TaxID=520092 RepID=A0A4R6YWP3_9GAMM|nr:PilX N-terminal domain-containing pilus assembly protein [Tahibacter aquaticus]TDR43107.1 type IV pilus assembly protein PilX [Tahibacter aquaticus]